MDLIDSANEVERIFADAAISEIQKSLKNFDVGIAGECAKCGEEMPRLVKGVCCPCRDKYKLG